MKQKTQGYGKLESDGALFQNFYNFSKTIGDNAPKNTPDILIASALDQFETLQTERIKVALIVTAGEADSDEIKWAAEARKKGIRIIFFPVRQHTDQVDFPILGEMAGDSKLVIPIKSYEEIQNVFSDFKETF